MKSLRDYIDPTPSNHGDPMTTTIIPHHSLDHIITKDDSGFHITTLGAEQTVVDEASGEVRRTRPALHRIDIPRVRPSMLAAILDNVLSDQGGSARSVEMAKVLLRRSMAHINDLDDRAAKLAAKAMVAKA